MTNSADFLPKIPSRQKYLITIFSAHFVHVKFAKKAIFYEIPSKTDLGEHRAFGGAQI